MQGYGAQEMPLPRYPKACARLAARDASHVPQTSAQQGMGNSRKEHLQLSVSNTFLHVRDVDEEAVKLGHSWSDPTLSSSSDPISSEQGNSVELRPENRKITPGANGNFLPDDACHLVFPSDCSDTLDVDGELSQDDLPAIERPVQSQSSTLLSLGSADHEINTCKPCLFMNQEGGCHNGSSCVFCHYTHNRKTKPRLCKGKRDRYNKLILRHQVMCGVAQPDGSSSAPNPGAASSGNASHKLML